MATGEAEETELPVVADLAEARVRPTAVEVAMVESLEMVAPQAAVERADLLKAVQCSLQVVRSNSQEAP